MVDDVLVGGTALCERVQLVHVVHVAPQRAEGALLQQQLPFYLHNNKVWMVPNLIL